MIRLVVVVSLLLVASTAHAGEVGVVVDGEPALRAEVAEQLARWLRDHGHAVAAAPLPADAAGMLTDCFVLEDEACARAIVDKKATTRELVYARVDVTAGGDATPTVTIAGSWLTRGQPVVSARRTCERCAHDALRAATDELLAALARAGGKPTTGVIAVTSDPPGARVAIDRRPAGTTPLDRELPPGRHAIAVTLPGRAPVTREIELAAGQTVPVVVHAPRRDRRWPMLAIAAGGGLALTGAVLIAIDEDPARDKPPEIRDTAPAGYGLALVGLAVAAGGYAWWRLGARDDVPTVAITSRGTFVGWAGRF